MRREKGQAVVEFALVLPLFLVIVFGVIFSGLLYADYLTLANVARSSAREAAIRGESEYSEIISDYYSQTKLLTNLYKWNESDFTIASEEVASHPSVKVTLTAELNSSFPGAGAARSWKILPEKYKIEYSMYQEPNQE